MSTEKIREALGALLVESARANDFAGGPREPGGAERELYRAALVEVETIERAHRLAHQAITGAAEGAIHRAVLDPRDVLEDLGRLRRIIPAPDNERSGGRS